jgi:hypothetical protein
MCLRAAAPIARLLPGSIAITAPIASLGRFSPPVEPLRRSLLRIAQPPGGTQTCHPASAGTRVADAARRGVVQQSRAAILQRRPHTAARAIWLEVHLIQRSKLNALAARVSARAFLGRLVGLGRHAQSAAGFREGEIRKSDLAVSQKLDTAYRRARIPCKKHICEQTATAPNIQSRDRPPTSEVP